MCYARAFYSFYVKKKKSARKCHLYPFYWPNLHIFRINTSVLNLNRFDQETMCYDSIMDALNAQFFFYGDVNFAQAELNRQHL